MVNDAASSSGSVSSCSSRPDFPTDFLNLVKKTFEHQPGTYREILPLFEYYHNYRTSLDRLTINMHLLFKGNKELLKGFNQFVPAEYKGCNDFKFKDAIAFVRKIEDPNMSESFLEVLNKYSTGIYDIEDTILEACKIFKGHPYLLMQYRKYLPQCISEHPQVAVNSALSESAAIVYVNKVKERLQNQPEKHRGFLTILDDFKNLRIDEFMAAAKMWKLLKGNLDLIMGFNVFLPKDGRMMLIEFDPATDIINTIQGRLKYDLSMVAPFIEIVHHYILDRITFDDFYTEVMERLKNHPAVLDELKIPIFLTYLSMSPARRHLLRDDLIEGFNEFLPEHCKMKVLVAYYGAIDITNTIQHWLRYNLWRTGPFIKIIDQYNVGTFTFDDFYIEM